MEEDALETGCLSQTVGERLAAFAKKNVGTLPTKYWIEHYGDQSKSLVDVVNAITDLAGGEEAVIELFYHVQRRLDRGTVENLKGFVAARVRDLHKRMAAEPRAILQRGGVQNPVPPSVGPNRRGPRSSPSQRRDRDPLVLDHASMINAGEFPPIVPIAIQDSNQLTYAIGSIAMTVAASPTFEMLQNASVEEARRGLHDAVGRVATAVHPFVDVDVEIRVKLDTMRAPSPLTLGTIPFLLKDRMWNPTNAVAIFVRFEGDQLLEKAAQATAVIIEAYPSWAVYNMTFSRTRAFNPSQPPYDICQLGPTVTTTSPPALITATLPQPLQ